MYDDLIRKVQELSIQTDIENLRINTYRDLLVTGDNETYYRFRDQIRLFNVVNKRLSKARYMLMRAISMDAFSSYRGEILYNKENPNGNWQALEDSTRASYLDRAKADILERFPIDEEEKDNEND